jgi:hypothetical protein
MRHNRFRRIRPGLNMRAMLYRREYTRSARYIIDLKRLCCYMRESIHEIQMIIDERRKLSYKDWDELDQYVADKRGQQ